MASDDQYRVWPRLRLSDHDRIVAEKDASLDQYSRDIRALENTVAERDAEIARLRGEIDDLERRIDLTECGGPR